MDEAESGRVLRTGVPGAFCCVRDVLLEDSEAELVSRDGVEVEVDRGSFGEIWRFRGKELPFRVVLRLRSVSSAEGSTTTRLNKGFLVSTMVWRFSDSSQFSTKASC